MEKLIKTRKESFDGICCILKALALFFCFYPLFGVFFKYSPQESLSEINLGSMVISLGLLALVLGIWLVLQPSHAVSVWRKWLEIAVFYGICLASIICSGANDSDYKFMFIFMVVTYTLQYGLRYGLVITVAASLTLLGMDFYFYAIKSVAQSFQSDIALSIMFGILAYILGGYVRMETDHINRLTYLASYDSLTKLYNHRYFHDEMERQWKRHMEQQCNVSLIMMDIDYFKQYNDFCGHQEGDKVLEQVSRMIMQNTRSQDIACRYGGEEFAIIMPNTSVDEARIAAERIRRCVADMNFPGSEYLPNKKLTMSLGVAMMNKDDSTHNDVITRADTALYRAKYLRKNRVESYQNVFDQFESLDEKARDALISVKGLVGIVNVRDDYTYSHTERVVYCCELMADALNLSPEDRRSLIIGAYMHDIGKVNIPREVLISSHRLTDEEWLMIKNHPTAGKNIISQISGMESVGKIVEQHHERFDGKGYPYGIAGNDLEPLARILTLADSFDAMTNNRPYQKRKTIPEALAEIEACKGTQFDPEYADIFIRTIRDTADETRVNSEKLP